jgi:hypothetical protein
MSPMRVAALPEAIVSASSLVGLFHLDDITSFVILPLVGLVKIE